MTFETNLHQYKAKIIPKKLKTWAVKSNDANFVRWGVDVAKQK